MSRLLNETAILDKVHEKITGYGRTATFYESNDSTNNVWYITPPQQLESMIPTEESYQEQMVFLVSAKGIPFTPTRQNRVTDGKTTLNYNIIDVKPIDSGDLTQAYKITVGR